MTDSVAQDHLLKLAHRIDEYRLLLRDRHYARFGATPPAPKRHLTLHTPGSRLPRRLAGEGVADDAAARWLEICEILCRNADDFDAETRRGWTIACRLLGLSWSETRNALSDVHLFGVVSAAPLWAPYMGQPDPRFIGILYTAEAVGRPDIIKVGFSTNPNRRMLELARTQHAHVRLIATRPATMLHEWALHHLILGAIEPEWYPIDQLPSFLRPERAFNANRAVAIPHHGSVA